MSAYPDFKATFATRTPATLGEAYFERVRKGGLFTEIRMMP